jgi:hypothetical protein
VNDLVNWLRAQLDEDAQVALEVSGSGRWCAYEECDADGWTVEDSIGDLSATIGDQAMAWHIAIHDPARVLAEVEAKQRILRIHEGRHECRSTWPPDAALGEVEWTYGEREYEADEPCPTLSLLALPYAARPGYRPEWAPDGQAPSDS